jgi:hypothetical protein
MSEADESAPGAPREPTQLEAALKRAERAAMEAEFEAGRVLDQLRRRGRIVEVAVGFTAPPLVGIAILILVFSGRGSDAVMHSSAATATALIIGGLLMLVPPVVFALSPDSYAEYQTDVERRLRNIAQLGAE